MYYQDSLVERFTGVETINIYAMIIYHIVGNFGEDQKFGKKWLSTGIRKIQCACISMNWPVFNNYGNLTQFAKSPN